jgi:hypothetical protein
VSVFAQTCRKKAFKIPARDCDHACPSRWHATRFSRVEFKMHDRNTSNVQSQTDHDLWSNRLLDALAADSRARIDPHLESVESKLGAMVCDAGGLLKHAYFPRGSVLSLLTVLENGAAIETANIGREGAFGLFAAMYSRVSFNRCIVQLEGHTVRCPIELLQHEFQISEHVRNLFVSYSETLLSQVQQTVAAHDA